MSAPTARPTGALPTYHPIERVSEITHLSKSTLHNMHSRGEGPPAHKVGKRLLYREDLLIEWIEGKATFRAAS